MATDIRPANQWPKKRAAIAEKAPAWSPAFLVLVGPDLYELSDVGPADAFWVEDVNGDFTIEPVATDHDGAHFFKAVDFYLR